MLNTNQNKVTDNGVIMPRYSAVRVALFLRKMSALTRITLVDDLMNNYTLYNYGEFKCMVRAIRYAYAYTTKNSVLEGSNYVKLPYQGSDYRDYYPSNKVFNPESYRQHKTAPTRYTKKAVPRFHE